METGYPVQARMPTKRDLLAHLNRDELQDIVAHFGLAVDGRSNVALREAVAASKKAKLPPILGGYPIARASAT